MKFATIQLDGRRAVAVIDPDKKRVWPLESLLGEPVDDLLDVIRRYDEIKGRINVEGEGIGLSRVRLEAPIPRPARNIFCVGKNYHDHAREFAGSGYDSSATGAADAVPALPIFFTKVPESVIGPDEAILYPRGISEQIDYEVELALVIGTGGKNIAPEDAHRHVWGYTVINDVTARDVQKRHKQWLLGKSFDTFCPMGPWVVTADELDPTDLQVKTWVNGELRQNANTRDLIFDIPTLVATASAGITLYPGDIIATGTPAGVGLGFSPPKFLFPGDRVTVEVSGIGALSNTLA
ncbi:fumarylacetoacetate hydrolase family protein [Azospirillum brasilense]|uniref:FAA hydrolase family protein n=1 Tax=Azospirillum brasilense TaxID=192 RepID=A0A6L3AU18_AZOBR|nr:fumarylacetoacetate hydrolase family protein [Azospirillum brasilense]KAA0679610.1 FAA hydrolase family protein [Azospirillum brasilense]